MKRVNTSVFLVWQNELSSTNMSADHVYIEPVMTLVSAGFVAMNTMAISVPGSPQEMISIPGRSMKRHEKSEAMYRTHKHNR